MVTRPAAPYPFAILSWTNVRVNGKAKTQNNGGSAITEWQVAWGLKPGEPQFYGNLNLDGTGFISGLTPGKTYYFWNRQRNSTGIWSDFSPRTDIKMKDAPNAPKPPAFDRLTQTSVVVIVVPTFNGLSSITSYKLVYGLSPTNSDNLLVNNGSNPVFRLSNLEPGKRYYFWGRTTNIYGDSDWSARSQVDLIAGAWVKVGFVWKRAVPYVRDAGVWKMAQPYVRRGSYWQKTIN